MKFDEPIDLHLEDDRGTINNKSQPKWRQDMLPTSQPPASPQQPKPQEAEIR